MTNLDKVATSHICKFYLGLVFLLLCEKKNVQKTLKVITFIK